MFRDIEDELARLWGDNDHSRLTPSKNAFGAADIQETKNGYTFTVDAPGLTKEDISVQMTPDNVLVISGERTLEEKKEEEAFRRSATTAIFL